MLIPKKIIEKQTKESKAMIMSAALNDAAAFGYIKKTRRVK